MPSVTSKLLAAGIVAESDLWRIATSVVAVNPAKFAAVQAYIDSLRFGPMQAWLSRGYYATDVGLNDIDTSVVLYRKSKVLQKPATSAVVFNNTSYGDAVGAKLKTSTNYTPITVVAQAVRAASIRFEMNAAAAATHSVPEGTWVNATNSTLSVMPLSMKFANTLNVGPRSTWVARCDLTTASLGGAAPAGLDTMLVVADVKMSETAPVVVKASTKDWPLIEGPSVFTYAEVITSSKLSLVVVFCNFQDIAEAIRAAGARYQRDVTTVDMLKKCDEKPYDGFCYFRNGGFTLNPLSLIPEISNQADEVLAGIGTTDGVDYTPLRTSWGPGSIMIGGYTTADIDTSQDSDAMTGLLDALDGAKTVMFKVDMNETYKTDADISLTLNSSEFNMLAVGLAAKGVSVGVTPTPAINGQAIAFATQANTRIANYGIANRSVTVNYDGGCSNLGHLLCGAILTDQESAAIKLAKGFVSPSYFTTV